MGDRCYMEITCHKQDQERFTALGFVAQDWKQDNSALVVVVDEQANYGHCGDLPTDLPYHGFSGSGGDYGEAVFACDGTRYAEVETGHGGGFVVDWNEARHRPSARSLKRIRRYIQVRNQVLGVFERQAKPK